MPDVYGNGIIRRDGFFIPNLFIDLIDGKYTALILNQQKQDIVLNGCELDWLPVYKHFFFLIIYSQSSGCVNMLTFAGNGCPKLSISAKL